MHFTTASILSLLALNLATAYVIPRDARDGTYTLNARDEIIEFVPIARELVDRGISEVEVFPRLPRTENLCTLNALPAAGLAGAVSQLKNWCGAGNKVRPHSKTVFTFQGAVAYVCSYGNDNPCSAGEFDEAANLWGAQGNCRGKSGWTYIPDWAKTYGQDLAGASVCGNLEESDPAANAAKYGGMILGGIAKGFKGGK